MHKYAIIENGKVINTVMSDHDYAAEQGWVSCSDNAGIDWNYTNGQFVDNRPQPEVVTPPAPTKEELLAQLNAIAAQINALE